MCGKAPVEKERAVKGRESYTPVLWKIAEPTYRRADNVNSVYCNNQNFTIIKGEKSVDGISVKLQFLPAQWQRGYGKVAPV